MKSEQQLVFLLYLIIQSYTATLAISYKCPESARILGGGLAHQLPLDSAQTLYTSEVGSSFDYNSSITGHCTIEEGNLKVCSVFATTSNIFNRTILKGGAGCKGRDYCPALETYTTDPTCKSTSADLYACCFIMNTSMKPEAVWTRTILELKKAKLAKGMHGYGFEHKQPTPPNAAEEGEEEESSNVTVPVVATVVGLFAAIIILVVICYFCGKRDRPFFFGHASPTSSNATGSTVPAKRRSRKAKHTNSLQLDENTPESYSIPSKQGSDQPATAPSTDNSNARAPPPDQYTSTSMRTAEEDTKH